MGVPLERVIVVAVGRTAGMVEVPVEPVNCVTTIEIVCTTGTFVANGMTDVTVWLQVEVVVDKAGWLGVMMIGDPVIVKVDT